MMLSLLSSQARRFLQQTPWWGALILMPSCTGVEPGGDRGTDTGNPIGPLNGDERVVELFDPECDEADVTIQSVAWDEPVLGTLTAKLLFSTLPRSTIASVRWNEGVAGQSGGEETELSVTIRPLGTATLIAPRQKMNGDEPANDGPVQPEFSGVSCAGRLLLDVEMKISTADGALDETFITQITSQHSDLAFAHLRLPIEKLTGSLKALDVGEDIDSLDLVLTYSKVGMQGELILENSLAKATDLEPPSPRMLASFPIERPCGEVGFLLRGEDTLFGFSPADLHASFEAMRETTWQLEHEEGTIDVTCDVELPETLCVGQAGTQEFLTTVTLSSSDGSLKGSFQVNIHALGGDDGFAELGMHGGKVIQELGETDHSLGSEYALVDPAPLDGFSGAATDFIVYVSEEPWGVFRYEGLTTNDCSNATQTCSGVIPTTLFGMHFGEPKFGYELDRDE